MIAVDGMPGAGKTTLLTRLHHALSDRMVVFPEAQPPQEAMPEDEITRFLLEKARNRRERAQRLARSGLVVASDRCHLGVLLYRFALATCGRASYRDFTRAMAISEQLGLLNPDPDMTVLLLTTDIETSLRRRAAHAHDARYRLWYDREFLNAYRYGLHALPDCLPNGALTICVDTTTDSGWQQAATTLRPHLPQLPLAEEAS